MATKTVFLFDPVTGLFTGIYEAHESPEEPGKFVAPDHSTPHPVPVLAANEAAVFDVAADAWTVVPDFRGQTFYDKTNGAPVVIDTHGAPPAGLASTKPAAILLADAKTARIAFIENEYELREHADIVYMGATFQADDEAQKLISRVLSAQGGTAPAGFGWYDITNTKVAMTNTQLQGLANAILLRNQPLFENKQTRKAAIRAATTVAAVNAVVW